MISGIGGIGRENPGGYFHPPRFPFPFTYGFGRTLHHALPTRPPKIAESRGGARGCWCMARPGTVTLQPRPRPRPPPYPHSHAASNLSIRDHLALQFATRPGCVISSEQCPPAAKVASPIKPKSNSNGRHYIFRSG